MQSCFPLIDTYKKPAHIFVIDFDRYTDVGKCEKAIQELLGECSCTIMRNSEKIAIQLQKIKLNQNITQEHWKHLWEERQKTAEQTRARKKITSDEVLKHCIEYDNCFIAIVWPRMVQKDNNSPSEVEKMLESCGGDIIYTKDVELNYANAMKLIWLLGGRKRLENFDEYFPSDLTYKYPAHIIVVDFEGSGKNLENKIYDCKESIRNVFGGAWYSIHIDDYHVDAVRLARYFFGEPAVTETTSEVSSREHKREMAMES